MAWYNNEDAGELSIMAAADASEFLPATPATPFERSVPKGVQDMGVWDTDRKAKGKHFCRRCVGTGQFITMVVNGHPKGPGGICFRCGGKGYHNEADRKRNLGYDICGRKAY